MIIQISDLNNSGSNNWEPRGKFYTIIWLQAIKIRKRPVTSIIQHIQYERNCSVNMHSKAISSPSDRHSCREWTSLALVSLSEKCKNLANILCQIFVIFFMMTQTTIWILNYHLLSYLHLKILFTSCNQIFLDLMC